MGGMQHVGSQEGKVSFPRVHLSLCRGMYSTAKHLGGYTLGSQGEWLDVGMRCCSRLRHTTSGESKLGLLCLVVLLLCDRVGPTHWREKMEGHIVLRLSRSLLVQCILYRMCERERKR